MYCTHVHVDVETVLLRFKESWQHSNEVLAHELLCLIVNWPSLWWSAWSCTSEVPDTYEQCSQLAMWWSAWSFFTLILLNSQCYILFRNNKHVTRPEMKWLNHLDNGSDCLVPHPNFFVAFCALYNYEAAWSGAGEQGHYAPSLTPS